MKGMGALNALPGPENIPGFPTPEFGRLFGMKGLAAS